MSDDELNETYLPWIEEWKASRRGQAGVAFMATGAGVDDVHHEQFIRGGLGEEQRMLTSDMTLDWVSDLLEAHLIQSRPSGGTFHLVIDFAGPHAWNKFMRTAEGALYHKEVRLLTFFGVTGLLSEPAADGFGADLTQAYSLRGHRRPLVIQDVSNVLDGSGGLLRLSFGSSGGLSFRFLSMKAERRWIHGRREGTSVYYHDVETMEDVDYFEPFGELGGGR